MSENEIDPDLSRWILEFLLHQEIEDHILNPIVTVLPVPKDDFTVHKLLLLRKLENAAKPMVSEHVLDYLDEIYEFERNSGVKDCSEGLKRAYCAVAVECSVGYLRNGESDVKGEYFEVVKRLWRGRVRRLEEGGVGLVSEELLEWRDDIEAAVWEETVCRRVVERGKGIDGLEAVRGYVKDEKSRMGPSFLELVSETWSRGQCRIDDNDGSDDRGKGVVEDGGKRNEKSKMGPSFVELVSENVDRGKGVMVDGRKRNGKGKRKHAAYKRARPVTYGSCRGIKIVDVDDSGGSQSCSERLLGSPEVEKVQEAPNEGIETIGDQNLELPRGQDRGKSSEKNVEKGQSDEANLGEENVGVEPTGDQDRAKSGGFDDAVNVQSGEANIGDTNLQTGAPRSLMERNETARTLEWNDSIDNSSMDPAESSLRPHLPSPRERRVLPSNMLKEQNPRPPRKKMWSSVEEDTLRAGVEKFGRGYWKLILGAYRDIFVGRTTVDLKDKWRNMTRWG